MENETKTRTYDILKAALAQKKYCDNHGFPHFAPQDGCCRNCGKNIYVQHEKSYGKDVTITTGISVEEAGKSLVTGCPHCNISYCD
ncbi:MAG: hypothetical protein IJX51_08645 [Clostridia bacterium]|nr:hypothetical protein [Clostridia bacterium]